MSRARDLADSADKDIVGTLTLDDLSVSGTITGDVTGDLTGDVTGDVTGNVTGNITGNVTGDVTGDVDLTAISATISDTAVDIFVYDTRKDSDGGAWRKRTQHTSWYNETLNTSTRGSRKEFPAVAVIVAESTTITIYDGDDPDLPMWMVFNSNGSTYSGLRYQARATNAITAINGILYTANGTTDGVYYADFLKDHTWRIHTTNWYGPVAKTLAGRNEAIATSDVPVQAREGLVQFNANDVAATVLPNAPIDAATGLPVPTIAVATNGGVSVIKDDGSVVSRSIAWVSSGGVFSVDFDGEGYWYNTSYHDEYDGTYPAHGGVYSFSDLFSTSNLNSANARVDNNLMIGTGAANSTNTYWGADIDVWVPNGTDANLGLVDTANGKYFSSRNGLTVVEDDGEIFSYITKDYNTGYMSGKDGGIKLATLSDTDDTDVTGSELVTNGTFDTDTSGWNVVAGTLTYSSGQAVLSNATAYHPYFYQTVSVTSGKTYVLSVDITAISGQSCQIRVFTDGSFATTLAVKSSITTTGTHNITFTATGSTHYIRMAQITASSGDSATFDNISVRLAEEDRSVNGNGLQVFGTVTKNPVATGADLVGYSGWSGSNYLQQPYNADLDLAAGQELFVCGWVNYTNTTGNQILISMRPPSGTGTNWWQLYSNGTSLEWIINQNSLNYSHNASVVQTGVWQFLAVKASSSGMQIYYNGELKATRDIVIAGSSDTSSLLKIGVHHDTLYPVQGSMALWRVSKTVPSPEQIAKIYEDEKRLFQENAQATLYGTSDAVTALAYDDSTELLHIGTSAGRSVFQGLRRVDNTTTAVGAAISASNGLVADE